MGRRGGIPDRWTSYKPLGKRIGGTPFIAFKCPLKEGLIRNLPKDERFTTQVLMEMVPNLGLVIDLTNTDRYYDKEDFLRQGIRYEKIFCRGHEIPSQSVVDKFFSAVDNYLKSSSAENGGDKLIGVHCTHGLNRTGYLVCRYMIRRLGFRPEDAISAFEKERGYPMEREQYLQNLREDEESPKSPQVVASNVNTERQNIQHIKQNNENPSFALNVHNGLAGHCPDNWPDNDSRGAEYGGFIGSSRNGNFQRSPTNVRRGGSGNFSRGTRGSFSWNYRDDFCSSSTFPPRSFGASSHPYQEVDLQERDSRNSRSGYGRFYEEDFEDMRPHRYNHRSRSSSSVFPNSSRYRYIWRSSNQFN